MKKLRKPRPEEALRLRKEINQFCEAMGFFYRELGEEPKGFPRELLDALWNGDPKFFKDLAGFYRMESEFNRSPVSQQNEQLVRRLAVQSRIWLELNKKSLTRNAIRELTVNVWSARLIGFKPVGTIVETTEKPLEIWTAEHLGGLKLSKKLQNIPFTEYRSAAESRSDLDYITAVQSELQNPENTILQAQIEHASRSFTKHTWKRVWLDPLLCDIKPTRGRPPGSR